MGRVRNYEDMMEMKALPAPEHDRADLISWREDGVTVEQEKDNLALQALIYWRDSLSPVEPSLILWETDEKPGWEVALVESASNLAQATGKTLAGGFSPLLLNSMYEFPGANTIQSGSESSVASTGTARPASGVLALPAPQAMAMPGQDPFAASAIFPPPSYVQMADVLRKQQLLTQEQRMWQQYQNEGMGGYYSMMSFHNYQNAYLQPWQTQLALPYYNQGMYRQFSYI